MQQPLTGRDFSGGMILSQVLPGVAYRLERTLGQGATATAYFATRCSSQVQAPVVMKVILPEVASEAGETAAMLVAKEAVALGRLNERIPPTPFVVRFMDTGLVPYQHGSYAFQLPWLAVEYVHGGVEGTTLEERVDFAVKETRYAFERERAARALSHICQGLEEVHAVGVIHRDLTPNNVLCCGFAADELFKISDFGIARPKGLAATFGSAVVGTPGYIAPEHGVQLSGEAAPSSDIFSLAGIAYFVLTGEPYFDVENPVQAMLAAREPTRRALADAKSLCPELRQDPDACRAIDEALSRASGVDPKLRPASAKAFGATVLPWLASTSAAKTTRQRYVTSVLHAQVATAAAGWTWTIRHSPGDDRVLRSVAWDGDGHCLAATGQGLSYWNGTDWLQVQAQPGSLPHRPRFVGRIAPGRWLLGCEGARLAEYSRSEIARILRGPDEQVAFTLASGDVDDLAVLVAECAGQPPRLYALAGGYWLKPLPVQRAANLSGLGRIDETRWLVVGRSVDGLAFAAVYSPLQWELEPLRAPSVRALVACASQYERNVAVAVGRQVEAARLQGEPDLASAAVDVLDRTWAGGAGELWVSPEGGRNWSRVWSHDEWRVPFVSILADVGLVVAMTADGGVLECHTAETRTSLLPGSIPPTVVGGR
jgi:serine/threonine protein kinase